MDLKELKEAAENYCKIRDWQNFVSKERFFYVAKTCFNYTDERDIDMMFGLFQILPRMSVYLTDTGGKYDNEKRLTTQGLKVAEKAYEIAHSYNCTSWNDMLPFDEHMYFYETTDSDNVHRIAVDFKNAAQVIAIAELFKSSTFDGIRAVVRRLGGIESKDGINRTNIPYYDGDIYLMYSDVTDRIFYDYYDSDDQGVFVATEDGWRKLLYTPHRGYVDGKKKLLYENDTKYSNYMLNAAGKKFRYIGNIYEDISVLIDK